MVKVGVIGYGHWGPNHVRSFSQMEGVEVSSCADMDENRLKAVKRLYPQTGTTTDYRDILKDSNIDAVCISAPTSLHFQLAKEALQAGKHVLCEKPLALSSDECAVLGELAAKAKKVLMVGHVFLFNAGITCLKDYIQSDELGRVHYAHSERTNLGPFRYDVNALWDLAPHDISIFNYLFDSVPVSVSARGQKHLSDKEDLAFATLEYPNGTLVNVHVSWLDPKKVRQITVVGDKKMVAWDDLDASGPVKLYDKHVEKTTTFYETYNEFQLLSREGNIMIPKVNAVEPLKVQDQYFIDCITQGKDPLVADAQKARDVVRTLCAIQKSMDQSGVPCKV